MEGSDHTKVYLGDPTHSNKNIADPYVKPKGVEQLVGQCHADKKNITIPGLEVDMGIVHKKQSSVLIFTLLYAGQAITESILLGANQANIWPKVRNGF